MDNVQEHNSCINIPSSQTFRSLLITLLINLKQQIFILKIINLRSEVFMEAEVNKIVFGYQPCQLVKN
jgi:hypothetical protein